MRYVRDQTETNRLYPQHANDLCAQAWTANSIQSFILEFGSELANSVSPIPARWPIERSLLILIPDDTWLPVELNISENINKRQTENTLRERKKTNPKEITSLQPSKYKRTRTKFDEKMISKHMAWTHAFSPTGNLNDGQMTEWHQ